MTNSQTSFWTPARVAAAIGAVLLVVALAYLVSLPQNQFQPADLLEPKYAADADLGYWITPDQPEGARPTTICHPIRPCIIL